MGKTVAAVGAGHLAGYLGVGAAGKVLAKGPVGKRFAQLSPTRQQRILMSMYALGTVGGGLAAAGISAGRDALRDDELAERISEQKKTASAGTYRMLSAYEEALRK